MFLESGRILYSPTDLNAWLGCRHAIFLDLRALNGGLSPEENDDPQLALIQAKGFEHEQHYLEQLRASKNVIAIDRHGRLETRAAETQRAMEGGAEVIYQAQFLDTPWNGAADFLIRVERESNLGAHSYEPVDTKLARAPQAKHVLQLCVYARMLAQVQGRSPEHIHLVLGDGTRVSYPLAHFVHYAELAQRRLEAFAAAPPATSAAEHCAHCRLCDWQTHCEAEWERLDHLSRVANISRSQIVKLRLAGIDTMRALGGLPARTRIEKLQAETLARLRQQARLQTTKLESGRNVRELLPPLSGKGFARLPQPDPGDLFFDMEGDPLFEDGLEYLFGFAFRKGGETVFQPFWGHTRAEEKRAFEQAMDFIAARLAAHPHAHIYHYANYEQAAFNRLSTRHGTREAALDDLLRKHKFVDLFAVVREAIRVSEPSYSIKNLEKFYMPAREGELASGGDSVVVYEHWRELQDPALLQQIEDYNATDCRSTLLLREWLLGLRPGETPWFIAPEQPDQEKIEARTEAERACAAMTARLCEGAAASEAPFRELVAQLLEFHRREAKPQYWAMFHRQEMSTEALIDDAECLGGLTRDPKKPPVPDKQSLIWTYAFPAQDFKLREGDAPKIAETLAAAGTIHALDEVGRTVQLRIGKARELPEALSLIPSGPYITKEQRAAVYRYAEAVASGRKDYAAITGLLRKEPPRVAGVKAGLPIIAGETTLDSAVAAICALKSSALVVQGPPGTGKTYTASHAIVELLKQKKRIGVSSNSHKAIIKLLEDVEKVAAARKVKFRGAKKCSEDEHEFDGRCIVNLRKAEDVSKGDYQLIAGTSWLFAREEWNSKLDYMFIDEAGQVSVGNVVAMGTAASNIVLIGDQMQLAQPSQAVHPGESGRSALEFALGVHATVPPELGIFLPRTRRMHPDVCRFVSDAFYDGRLQPEAGNETQRLVLGRNADAALAPTGLRFVEVAHTECSQKSEIEAARLAVAYHSLLKQRWIDRNNREAPFGVDDILVVSPYNMQVDELRRRLPDGARVGTVDKFQGQEAPAVLISMATSSAEEMSRGIDFLFSRNRLNVAISRARCLAVIFASPRLLEAPCTKVDQLRMVDALCWARIYAEANGEWGTIRPN